MAGRKASSTVGIAEQEQRGFKDIRTGRQHGFALPAQERKLDSRHLAFRNRKMISKNDISKVATYHAS
ncbi:hypothetical protein BHYA_0206g00040 [Botrytis hyacinthi]|uniref:Uncharacterized protein n=1 Tax=Botrytis hyacinthi TaxID=278943 RepID=A0A4Z1GK04_9HELO|nr:hypothetical protein BHYA_0206g00040 [Botrytis hyacinthi]